MGASKTVVVTPAMVREWATANGHTVPARGRLHGDIIEAYNKGNKTKFDSAVKADTGKMIALKGKRKTESGRTIPWQKSVSTTEIRKAAIDAGIPLGSRGRMPAEVIQAYADNTLADLAANWTERVTAKASARAEGFQILAANALSDDESGIIAEGPAVVVPAPEGDEVVEVTV